jgi:N-acetylmuramate 1-kinase
MKLTDMSDKTGDSRRNALQNWGRVSLQRRLGMDLQNTPLETVSGDASFRRYFRMRLPTGQSFILVDAPPEKENSQRFVRVADALRESGLLAPEVHEADFDLGFMLLEDFGDALYLPALLAAQRDGDIGRASRLYHHAIDSLVDLQRNCSHPDFPPYDQELLHRELSLFDEWYCRRFLELQLSQNEESLLRRTWDFLVEAALAQPVVCVHRDYHSRNLMIRHDNEDQRPGIVDFQDAVAGPYTYDLVSLLRDCYLVWPDDQVRIWALEYLARARHAGVIPDSLEDEDFERDFDLMGLQRHIKVVGIFCRLHLRDGKPRYLEDVPRVIDYVLRIADRYTELVEFSQWFRERLLPLTATHLAQAAADSGPDSVYSAAPDSQGTTA